MCVSSLAMVVLACYLDRSGVLHQHIYGGGYAQALSGGIKDRQRVSIRTILWIHIVVYVYQDESHTQFIGFTSLRKTNHRSPVEENRQSAFQTAGN